MEYQLSHNDADQFQNAWIVQSLLVLNPIRRWVLRIGSFRA
jgi:hypothetical protein